GAATERAAPAWIAGGVEPGGRVAMWPPNLLEWAVAAFAVPWVGAVVIPVNTRFKGDEAAYVLGAANVQRLFTVTDFLDTDYIALLRNASTEVDLDEIVILRGSVPDGCTSWTDFMARADGIDPAASRQR